MKKPFYITTTLPYVNADPHIGFALEIIHADTLARYKRLTGHEVFFSTGTDEHGQKISQKAKENEKPVQEYVDYYAGRFGTLKSILNLSYDSFVRTTDEFHVRAAQEIWRLCEANGDIYKKKYKGLYCVGDEAFIKEEDLVNGMCPNHPVPPIEIEEENYFFRLSNYQDALIEYLSDESVVIPTWRREEALTFVKQGLEDFSISRERSRMDWGVPVPGDDEQVMYVWFDALTNYISTLGWPDDAEGAFKKFWEEGDTVQLAGKDQVRFQSIMWQAMLISAGLPTTKQVSYHGFITSGGQKMSKSIGNVIDPQSIVEEYGTDALRYFLLRHMHSFEDSDFTMEKFREAYQANLANGIGNLVSRTMKMVNNYDVHYRLLKEEDLLEFDDAVPEGFKDKIESFDLKAAMDDLWREVAALDWFIQQKEPFKVAKTDMAAAQEIVGEVASRLYIIGFLLQPFMPETAEKIMHLVKERKMPEEPLFARLED